MSTGNSYQGFSKMCWIFSIFVLYAFLLIDVVAIALKLVYTEQQLTFQIFSQYLIFFVRALKTVLSAHLSFKIRSREFWKENISKFWKVKSPNVIVFIIFVIGVFASVILDGYYAVLLFKAEFKKINSSVLVVAQALHQTEFAIGYWFYLAEFYGLAVFLMKCNYLVKTLGRLAIAADFVFADQYISSHLLQLSTKYQECVAFNYRLNSDYATSVLLWFGGSFITQLFIIGEYCATKVNDPISYFLIYYVIFALTQLILLVDVSHRLESVNARLKMSLRFAEFSLSQGRSDSVVLEDLRSLRQFSERSFAFNVHGLFALDRTSLIAVAAFLIPMYVVLYQLSH